MSTIGNRAAILTVSRLANYGLMLISPVLLVRLLSVQDFGRYREFLLYASFLQSFAVFSINDSLLYCIPSQPLSPWRIVRQTAVLIACASAIVVAGLIVLDAAMGGGLVGAYRWPLVAYTLFSVNLDFWEYFWLARGRPGTVFIYSGSRLALRVLVATVTAAVTRNADSIIWALVAFEGLRLVAAAIAFVIADRARYEPPLAEPWRDQLRFCVPSGLASLLAMFNRNLSSLVVTRVFGVVALAQYSIGRFGEPVVTSLRSSVSAVVLPEMVAAGRRQPAALALWKRATVVNTIFLFPIAVLVARYAQPIVVTVFGASYAGAAIIMQLYMLVMVRECFDFAPALRAINKTLPLVASSGASLVTCAVSLFLLAPRFGIAGAMLAFVLGSWVDALYLAWRTRALYGVPMRELLPWSGIARTAVAALLASVLIVNSVWTDALGIAGIALACAAYVTAFALLLLALRVPEAYVLLDWAKKLLLVPARAARR